MKQPVRAEAKGPDIVSRGRRGLLLFGTAGLAGCALGSDADHDGEHAPAAAPLSRPLRTAWVLGSGGPRGFVHVGVIKALEELQLQPDLIVGASVGALVGALCAAGQKAIDIERMALELQPWTLLRWQPIGDERFAGSAVADFVNEQLQNRRLQSLPVALACAAQRMSDGQVVGFTRGDTGLAVQASAAIEGQFAPVRIRGERYADADARMPLPVRLARVLGARRVLAVDASAHEDRAPPGARRYRESDLRKRAITQPDAALSDVLLHPDFGYWVSFSRDFRERAIESGYRATMARAASLKAMHAAA